MRLTKLEHAALSIEKSGSRLFIDPGKFTTPITEAAGTVAIVITHEHDDHWTPEQLTRILARNPKTPIFTTPSAAEKILAANLPDIGEVIDVAAGESVLVGGFDLEFFGGEHAIIHSSIPRIENVGVLVEHGALYYGGDAYIAPDGVDIDVLAVCANAPWMRVAESMDYIERLRPKRVLPVHEMLLAKVGKTLATSRLRESAERAGAQLIDLQPFETLELD
ncbi:MBL fold metallo-hydrolase [Pseudoclavibacter sp. AY1F1]|uniref:MBL fold metallo-hydrolase n=1 Tax=Pseudoclavibacter sp. AY1F1 TaxID=2080583 RepID=UPI000CE76B2C|nr:MBL fold metallo-hydrolase [Pseudoclavibacter sp. AY1F1]PPF46047.1 MBL fold metallo-hydrolase [Pseudoclavibacter sp. AY1F1]